MASSYVDMSLEDIIKKKKFQNKSKGNMTKSNFKNHQPAQNFGPGRKIPITDARNKIISRKRTQITDAREKLAELAKQKDARLKLDQLRQKRQTIAQTQFQGRVSQFQGRPAQFQGRPPQLQGRLAQFQSRRNNAFMRNIANKETVFTDRSRQVVSQPLGNVRIPVMRHNINVNKFKDTRSIESRHIDTYTRPPKQILRTVENDLDNDLDIIDDPMGEDLMSPVSSLNRKASLQLKIIAHNNDVMGNKRIHRSSSEKEKSPPRPPSILKKRPMAALRSETKPEITEKPAAEYRIIVSNLRNTVTGGDIQELFGDVGGMVESRLVRPGTAEVLYKSIEDAQRAVELYHNRQLDGQPMNCLLVTPRSSASAASRSSSKPTLYSTNSNVEPDISTFHKVLFSNF